MITRTTIAGLLATLALVVAVSGCGNGLATDYAALGLVPVTGTVTLDGQPLADAVVFFESPDLTQSYATTDSDGYYELKFDSEAMGVTEGQKIVRISTTASTGETEEEPEEDGVDPRRMKKKQGPIDRVPAAYNTQSKIIVIVTPSSDSFEFALKSNGSMPVN